MRSTPPTCRHKHAPVALEGDEVRAVEFEVLLHYEHLGGCAGGGGGSVGSVLYVSRSPPATTGRIGGLLSLLWDSPHGHTFTPITNPHARPIGPVTTEPQKCPGPLSAAPIHPRTSYSSPLPPRTPWSMPGTSPSAAPPPEAWCCARRACMLADASIPPPRFSSNAACPSPSCRLKPLCKRACVSG